MHLKCLYLRNCLLYCMVYASPVVDGDGVCWGVGRVCASVAVVDGDGVCWCVGRVWAGVAVVDGDGVRWCVGRMCAGVTVSRRRQNAAEQVASRRVSDGAVGRTHHSRRHHSPIYARRSRSVSDADRRYKIHHRTEPPNGLYNLLFSCTRSRISCVRPAPT